mgnify:CR=1 FL=1
MPTFNQLVSKRSSDFRKEIYSTCSAEGLQLSEKEEHKRFCTTEERCLHSS